MPEATTSSLHAARDAEDARLLAAGEYSRLLASYYETILARTRAKIWNGHDALDVAHTVVTQLLVRLKSGKPLNHPFRVVVHKRIDFSVRDHVAGRTVAALPDDWEDDAGGEYQAVEDAYDFELLIAGLPPRVRDVVRRRWLHGQEIEQIAEDLGVKPNAVHQALHRGHRLLRKVVAHA